MSALFTKKENDVQPSTANEEWEYYDEQDYGSEYEYYSEEEPNNEEESKKEEALEEIVPSMAKTQVGKTNQWR